jgi:hypothetical protein
MAVFENLFSIFLFQNPARTFLSLAEDPFPSRVFGERLNRPDDGGSLTQKTEVGNEKRNIN